MVHFELEISGHFFLVDQMSLRTPAFWGCGNLPDRSVLVLTGRLPRRKIRFSQRHIDLESVCLFVNRPKNCASN